MASGGTPNIKMPSSVPDKSTCSHCGRPNDPKQVKFCSTCPAWLCQSCVIGHQNIPALKIHQLHDDQTSVGGSYTVCTTHSTSLAIFFCRTCKSVVCAHCQLDSKHQGHEVVDVKTKVKENKADVKNDMEKLKKVKTAMESALQETKTEYTAVDKKMQQYGKIFSSMVEEKRQTNREAVTSYETEIKQRVDDVSQNFKKCSLVDGKDCPLNMTEIATMSSDMHSCRVPEKPTLIAGVTSLIRTFAEATLTVDIRDALSKNRLEDLNLTIDRLQLTSSRPGLLRPVREYLTKNKIVFNTCDNISSIVGEQVSIVTFAWVQRYQAWLVAQNEKSCHPGELQHHQTHPDGYLDDAEHRFISKEQATALRSLFGCTRPLPLASKRNLLDHSSGVYYILSVKSITELNDVEGDVRVRLFTGAEQLPSGRLFYRRNEITEKCRGKQLVAFRSDLGLLPYDEISVLA